MSTYLLTLATLRDEHRVELRKIADHPRTKLSPQRRTLYWRLGLIKAIGEKRKATKNGARPIMQAHALTEVGRVEAYRNVRGAA